MCPPQNGLFTSIDHWIMKIGLRFDKHYLDSLDIQNFSLVRHFLLSAVRFCQSILM